MYARYNMQADLRSVVGVLMTRLRVVKQPWLPSQSRSCGSNPLKTDHQIAKPRDSSGTVPSSSVCPYICAILQSGSFLGLSLKWGAVRTYTLPVNFLRNDYD